MPLVRTKKVTDPASCVPQSHVNSLVQEPESELVTDFDI